MHGSGHDTERPLMLEPLSYLRFGNFYSYFKSNAFLFFLEGGGGLAGEFCRNSIRLACVLGVL